MALIRWKPSFSLGIPSVDHEHRELIGAINTVYDSMQADASPETIESCLEDIYADVASHFALEERLMCEADYEEYGAHKDEHEDLLDQIRDMMDLYEDDPESGRLLLQQKLSDWFGIHFATFDARLHHKLGDHH
jgi:hemerythrin